MFCIGQLVRYFGFRKDYHDSLGVILDTWAQTKDGTTDYWIDIYVFSAKKFITTTHLNLELIKIS